MACWPIQQLILRTTIANHFEREEALFKRGIKALSLFFIDSVGKYLPEGVPAVLRDVFEREYAAQLAQVLGKRRSGHRLPRLPERTQSRVQDVHKGYFARSLTEKGQEEAVQLISEGQGALLSFDTDLRVHLLDAGTSARGVDNPNIFTLCKLAPSDSSITKLQQIGRGLRLAVNQQLERIESDDATFDEVNGAGWWWCRRVKAISSSPFRTRSKNTAW
ncbi:MAG: hypothetical protein U1E74_05185 [Paenacidovorax caeni]